MNVWRFWLSQLSRRLWLRASLYGAFGLGAALVAALFSPFVPDPLAKTFGGGTVDGLLNVLATSLLAVATFSVAAMLTAYTNVSQSATPRAAALITSDSGAQSALATFVGAFIYAVVAFSALGTGFYRGGGRAILFLVTLCMLALVAITLLRWLDQLLSLARVGYAIDRVERAALHAIRGPFGARAVPRDCDPPPDGAAPVTAQEVGYVQNVDLPRLKSLCNDHGWRIWVEAAPGAFVHPGRVLARVSAGFAPERLSSVRDAFVVGDSRSFSQDPRFGLVVLGEIAARALSPGVNDPGTAIDVIGTAVRVLVRWRTLEEEQEVQEEEGVHLPRPTYADLLDDVFTPIARDGAGSLGVAIRLQKALAALAAEADKDRRPALKRAAEQALARSQAALAQSFDRERVAQAFAEAGW